MTKVPVLFLPKNNQKSVKKTPMVKNTKKSFKQNNDIKKTAALLRAY